MLSIVMWKELSKTEQKKAISRPIKKNQLEVMTSVRKIVYEIKNKGDKRLKAYTREFDGVECDSFKVTKEEIERAYQLIDKTKLKAIEIAIKRIERFHTAQIVESIRVESNGIICTKEQRPINRVGLYAPGGNAPLITSAAGPISLIPSRLAF